MREKGSFYGSLCLKKEKYSENTRITYLYLRRYRLEFESVLRQRNMELFSFLEMDVLKSSLEMDVLKSRLQCLKHSPLMSPDFALNGIEPIVLSSKV